MIHKNTFNPSIGSCFTGDFSVTIKNISKDKYLATTVKRSEKSIHQAIIEDLPDKPVLESVMEWRLISEQELVASESPVGTLVSQGTAQWTINRRSVPSGNYQVKFTASIKFGDSVSSETLKAFDYGFIKVISAPLRAIIDGGSSVLWGSKDTVTVDGSLSYDGDIGPGNYQVKFTASIKFGDSVSSETLKAFDYGFIKVISAPLRAIIDGGSSVLWGSKDTVTVDGSLSYDGDIGPGNYSGLKFTWSCYLLGANTSFNDNCFGSFKGDVTLTSIGIIPDVFYLRKKYVLRLTVSKDDRSHFAEIIFEIAAGEIPQVSLRYFKRIVLFNSSSLSVILYTQSFCFGETLQSGDCSGFVLPSTNHTQS